ncbi:MAG: YjjG family noncanonical pyrimidine nucleotidase [Muribaculaceae bacterium]|nr:YjjG family noncanonical pyrimidine nucleotidase [Muribaculaceae bacterium]
MNCNDTSPQQWIWIDLDDTLWDFKANSVTALEILFEQEEDLPRYFGESGRWVTAYQECNHRLWEEYNGGTITKEYLMLERFRRPLADAGCPAPFEKVLARHLDRAYLDLLGDMSALVPGARSLLEYLRSRGYRIGVLSNGFREVQHRKLRSSRIDHLIDLVVLSDDIGINKPDTRLFDYASDRAATTPRHCTMVGDNPDTDIAGALRAGWRAIYFDRDGESGPCRYQEALTITALHQLHELIV